MMKNLVLCMSGMVLLALHANGQQSPTKVTSSYSYSSSKQTSPATKSSTTSYSYHSSNTDQQFDDPMKSKTFSKSFSIDKSDKVNLANTYGSMTIKIWAKNEIKVDVDIKAYANTESEAQEMLDNASISASKDGDEVYFKTRIEEKNGNWGNGTRNGKRWRRELKVYYTVYMPAYSALNASQEYGSLMLDDYSGPTSLKVQYGNLTTGDLKNSNNYISVQYGKATLQNVNVARIRHQYGSGVTIGDANELDIDAQYTAVVVGNVKNSVKIKHQYGKGVTLASAGSVTVDAQYTGVNVGKISGNFTGKLEYGRLNVDSVEPGCKIFTADTEYSSVAIGFAPGYNGDFDVDVDYASFKYGANVTTKRNGGEDRGYSTSKSYSGHVGKGGPNKITVRSEYNSVTFK